MIDYIENHLKQVSTMTTHFEWTAKVVKKMKVWNLNLKLSPDVGSIPD